MDQLINLFADAFESLEERINNISAALEAMGAKIDALDGKILDAKIGVLDKVDTLDGNIGGCMEYVIKFSKETKEAIEKLSVVTPTAPTAQSAEDASLQRLKKLSRKKKEEEAPTPTVEEAPTVPAPAPTVEEVGEEEAHAIFDSLRTIIKRTMCMQFLMENVKDQKVARDPENLTWDACIKYPGFAAHVVKVAKSLR